jgi:hypothetical protein
MEEEDLSRRAQRKLGIRNEELGIGEEGKHLADGAGQKSVPDAFALPLGKSIPRIK